MCLFFVAYVFCLIHLYTFSQLGADCCTCVCSVYRSLPCTFHSCSGASTRANSFLIWRSPHGSLCARVVFLGLSATSLVLCTSGGSSFYLGRVLCSLRRTCLCVRRLNTLCYAFGLSHGAYNLSPRLVSLFWLVCVPFVMPHIDRPVR